MLNFYLGIGLGFCGSCTILFLDNKDRYVACFMGFILGTFLTFVCLMICLQNHHNAKKENEDKEFKDDWWREGNPPPWN